MDFLVTDYSLFELTGMLERLIRRTVKDTTSWDWDEDFITRSILSNLRNEFGDIQLQGRDDRKKTAMAGIQASREA